MYAAKLGSCEILTLLLHAGADINALNECNGLTALMYAALADKSLMVSLLLEHGADANATDNCGWTALHYASRLRGSNTAKAPFAGGYIDPNLRNLDGETALIAAKIYKASAIASKNGHGRLSI